MTSSSIIIVKSKVFLTIVTQFQQNNNNDDDDEKQRGELREITYYQQKDNMYLILFVDNNLTYYEDPKELTYKNIIPNIKNLRWEGEK